MSNLKTINITPTRKVLFEKSNIKHKIEDCLISELHGCRRGFCDSDSWLHWEYFTKAGNNKLGIQYSSFIINTTSNVLSLNSRIWNHIFINNDGFVIVEREMMENIVFEILCNHITTLKNNIDEFKLKGVRKCVEFNNWEMDVENNIKYSNTA